MFHLGRPVLKVTEGGVFWGGRKAARGRCVLNGSLDTVNGDTRRFNGWMRVVHLFADSAHAHTRLWRSARGANWSRCVVVVEALIALVSSC